MDAKLSLKPEEIRVGDCVIVVGYGWSGNIIAYRKVIVKSILKTKIHFEDGSSIIGIREGIHIHNLYPINMIGDIREEIENF